MIAHRYLAALVVTFVAAATSPAAADDPPSCKQLMQSAVADGAEQLLVVGVRLFAADMHGFSSFTMRDDYDVSQHPFNTQAAAERYKFKMTRMGNGFSGRFHETFPGDHQARADLWQVWIGRNGTLVLRSLTWSDHWQPLANVSCLPGPRKQFFMTGYERGAGFVIQWNFLVQPLPAR
jgi:hypothetical protein